MIKKSPLEPLARIVSADDEAASETTSFGLDGTDRGLPHPVALDRDGSFLGSLDDYLYSVSEEEGV